MIGYARIKMLAFNFGLLLNTSLICFSDACQWLQKEKAWALCLPWTLPTRSLSKCRLKSSCTTGCSARLCFLACVWQFRSCKHKKKILQTKKKAKMDSESLKVSVNDRSLSSLASSLTFLSLKVDSHPCTWKTIPTFPFFGAPVGWIF